MDKGEEGCPGPTRGYSYRTVVNCYLNDSAAKQRNGTRTRRLEPHTSIHCIMFSIFNDANVSFRYIFSPIASLASLHTLLELSTVPARYRP